MIGDTIHPSGMDNSPEKPLSHTERMTLLLRWPDFLAQKLIYCSISCVDLLIEKPLIEAVQCRFFCKTLKINFVTIQVSKKSAFIMAGEYRYLLSRYKIK